MNMHVDVRITRRAWQDAELALVTQLWGEGYSASQIAHRLEGRTRNAVIGCVSRLDLPERKCKRRTPVKRSGAATLRVARKRDPQIRHTRAEIREAKRLAKSRVWLPLPESNPVSLLERGIHQCAWPIGEALFCGEPKLRARSYCGAHCRLAYVPPEELK